LRYHEMLSSTSQLKARRAAQARDWMWSDVTDNLVDELRRDPQVREQLAALEKATSEGRIPPTVAAMGLLDTFLERHKKQGR
jgi:LAO/AO transport system kinase